MIITFQELYTEILTARGETESSVDANVLASIKQRINQIQDFIFYKRNWEWRKQRFYFTTRPPYETGTITVTQGSKTVTGSGTGWSDIMKIGYLNINANTYKIDPLATVTSTEVKLVAAYPEATEAGIAYKIIFPDEYLHPDISSVINIFIEDEEKSLVNPERQILSKQQIGEPTEFNLGGVSTFDFYTTGTVTLTNASTAVVGSGTAFTSDMEGMPFRVNEFSDTYVIQTVTDPTNIILNRAYQGDTGAGKSFKIAPKGSLLLHMRNVPDDYYFVEIEALIKPVRLVGATDISLIPNHAPLAHGSVWLAFVDLDDSKSAIRRQQAKEDFKETLQQLTESYKSVKAPRWQSEREIRAKVNGAGIFNPLDDTRRLY